MRGWEWSPALFTTVPLSLPLLLLAVMLFSAALLTDVSQIRLVSHHPLVLCVALLAVWLGPGLLVLAAGWLVPSTIDGQSTAGLLIGLALVATMPVANSSVGWTQNAGGNLGLALSLVVLSILLCPWVTPNLLSLWGMSLSPSEQAYCAALVQQVLWPVLHHLGDSADRGRTCVPLFARTGAHRESGQFIRIGQCRRSAAAELHQLGAGLAASTRVIDGAITGNGGAWPPRSASLAWRSAGCSRGSRV